jgi:hypothetical protein
LKPFDITVEGTVAGAPNPKIGALQPVFEKLAELKVKETETGIEVVPAV